MRLMPPFGIPVDFFEMMIKVSEHPRLAEFQNAPITKKLRKPGTMFAATDPPGAMVFKLIGQIEAASLCVELVETAHRYDPTIDEFRDLLLEMHTLPAAAADALPALEKAILIDPQSFADPAEALLRWALIQFQVCRIELVRPQAITPIGTGLLVASDLVLTNYHVIEDALKRQNDESPELIRVAFDRTRNSDGNENLDGPDYGLLHPQTEQEWLAAWSPPDAGDGKDDPIGKPLRSGRLDYALLRVVGQPADQPLVGPAAQGTPKTRGYFDLSAVGAHPFQAGEPLIILQHPQSDPAARPSYAPLVYDIGSVAGANAARLTYSTSTLAGSSGSPCLDRQFRPVAIHHAHIKTKPLNEGIPLQAIVEDLRSKDIPGIVL